MQQIIPLSYCIPDECIVDDVPPKKHIWAEVIPDFKETYRFGPDQQEEYYQMYRDSRFAFTWKKGGWDAIRHYEIIANGCIPVFRDLHQCPDNTMTSFPKSLLSQAMKDLIPWKQNEEYIEKYNSYVLLLLQWCRANMSCSANARYFIKSLNYKQLGGTPKILFITCDPHVNYLRDFLFIGMWRHYQQLGGTCVAWPKISFLHEDYSVSHLKVRHGMGFTYGRRLPAIEESWEESDIIESIRDGVWDYIVYAKIGRDEGVIGSIPTAPLWPIVSKYYNSDRIVFLYGEDSAKRISADHKDVWTNHLHEHAKHGICFVRELI